MRRGVGKGPACSFLKSGRQLGFMSSLMGSSPLKLPMYTLHTCATPAPASPLRFQCFDRQRVYHSPHNYLVSYCVHLDMMDIVYISINTIAAQCMPSRQP